MRRSDREITDFEEMVQVMQGCDVCRLALNDDGFPYILPLNFGVKVEDGQVTMYFHGASEGKKYELLEKDNRASFEMDCSHQLISNSETGHCTMDYESIIGRGRIEIVPEEEKTEALAVLTDHYHNGHFEFNPAAVGRTTVMKLVVEKMTGKRHAKKA